MDYRILINKVYIRTPLWDWSDPLHYNQRVLTELWGEIAREMRFPRDVVRNRWKWLRCCFKTELKSIIRAGEEGVTTYTLRWPYFFQLQFIKSQFARHLTKSNLLLNCSADNTVVELNKIDSGTGQFNSLSNVNSIYKNRSAGESSTTISDIRSSNIRENTGTKRKRDDENIPAWSEPNRQIKVKKENPEEEQDKDMNFFHSLLPHVKELSPNEKLRLQIKIQETVHHFVYNKPFKAFQRREIPQRVCRK